MPERETESDQGRRKKQFMVIPPSTLLHFLNWLFTKNTLHKCCQGRSHYKHKDKADSGESAKGSCTVLYLIFAFHFLSEKIIPFLTRLPFPWQLTSAHIRFIVFSFSFLLCVAFWAFPLLLHSTIHSPVGKSRKKEPK